MTQDEFFLTVSRGNVAAAQFLRTMFDIAHVWDDLIDRDVGVTPERIDAAFFNALVLLPRNEFYRQHFDLLNPLVISGIHNWYVANQLERTGDESDLRIAFVSRSGYIDLITQVAFLVGGGAWVAEIGPTIRRRVHEEGWEAYLKYLEAERQAQSDFPEGV